MFRSSRPVVADAFVNRERQLERLQSATSKLQGGAPTWLALIGRRKVGKTSLLLEYARTTTPPVHVVLMDTQEHAPVSVEIFRIYALRVIDALFSADAGQSFETLAKLDRAQYQIALTTASFWSTLPASIRPVLLALADHGIDASYLSLLLDLPEQLAIATETWMVCAWDEFQAFASWSGPSSKNMDVLTTLRSSWQRHERVAYVISGSAPTVLREMVTSPASPFFQHFDMMEIGNIPANAATRLLRMGGLEAAVATRAVSLLGGHPFYLQLFGEELLRLGAPIDDGTFKEALQNLLFRRTGRLALYFQREHTSYVGKARTLANTLEAVASFGTEGGRLTDVARHIGAPSGATRGYLDRLGDAVARHGDRWSIADPVFGLWLNWRQPAGSVLPMTLLGDEGEKRVAQALGRLGFELVYQSRASRGAFDLLAIRGPHQLGVQVKRSPMPLVFPLDAWKGMEGEAARLGWRALVAAANTEGVHFLDPAHARVGRTARIDMKAAIPNLLRWVDQR